MLSAVGGGALAAALALATLASGVRRGRLLGLGVGLAAAGLLNLSLAAHLAAALAGCALFGGGMILVMATSQSMVQLGAGDHNRGRVLGVWSMVLSAAQPLGNLLAGPAADRWGEPPVLLLQGAGCVAAALAVLGLRAVYSVPSPPGTGPGEK
jgi:hypothetical protein